MLALRKLKKLTKGEAKQKALMRAPAKTSHAKSPHFRRMMPQIVLNKRLGKEKGEKAKSPIRRRKKRRNGDLDH